MRRAPLPGRGFVIKLWVSSMLRNKVSNKSMENKEIRKLTRIGKRSIGLTLPIGEVRDLGWREKQKVVVKRVKGGLLIKDWK